MKQLRKKVLEKVITPATIAKIISKRFTTPIFFRNSNNANEVTKPTIALYPAMLGLRYKPYALRIITSSLLEELGIDQFICIVNCNTVTKFPIPIRMTTSCKKL